MIYDGLNYILKQGMLWELIVFNKKHFNFEFLPWGSLQKVPYDIIMM